MPCEVVNLEFQFSWYNFLLFVTLFIFFFFFFVDRVMVIRQRGMNPKMLQRNEIRVTGIDIRP
jgi:hypothetical protein